MTPPKAVVEKRRDLLLALASVAVSATLRAVPADFETWVAALQAREYTAWQHPDHSITVIAASEIGGRNIRVTAVFLTRPPFMTREQVDALPSFEGPKPAARLPFPEAA